MKFATALLAAALATVSLVPAYAQPYDHGRRVIVVRHPHHYYHRPARTIIIRR